MGEIYVAHDRKLDRIVAVKLLAERLSEDPDLRVRFRREALTAARSLASRTWSRSSTSASTRPAVHGHGASPGGTLAVRAGGGRVDPEQALAWLAQAAEALDAAHGHGIVHRDVAGEPPLRQLRQAPGRRLRDRARRRRDGGHDCAGTARNGRLPRPRAGRATRRRLQATATPWPSSPTSSSPAGVPSSASRRPPRQQPTSTRSCRPPRSRPTCPKPWTPCSRARLAKKPVHRFPTAAAFVDALSEALHGTPPPVAPPPARRPSAAPVAALVAGVMLLTIVGVGAALLVFRDDPPRLPRPRARRRPNRPPRPLRRRPWVRPPRRPSLLRPLRTPSVSSRRRI